MSLSTFLCVFFFFPSLLLFAYISLFLFSLSCASLSRFFYSLCSTSGLFVHPFSFQPVSFVFSRSLLSFVLVTSSPPVVLFFHLFLFTLFPSHPRPVARSAGIRGIFEPVHDGRLLQGRTFLQSRSEIFETKGLIKEIKSVRGFKSLDAMAILSILAH